MKFAELHAGQVIEAGPYLVAEEELRRFAEAYDPQWFHTDPEAAARGRFGGLIARIGPERCVVGREASAGVRIGQPLSNRDADAVVTAEGETGMRVNASACPVLRGRRPWHVRKLLERKPGDLDLGRA